MGQQTMLTSTDVFKGPLTSKLSTIYRTIMLAIENKNDKAIKAIILQCKEKEKSTQVT